MIATGSLGEGACALAVLKVARREATTKTRRVSMRCPEMGCAALIDQNGLGLGVYLSRVSCSPIGSIGGFGQSPAFGRLWRQAALADDERAVEPRVLFGVDNVLRLVGSCG